MNSRSVAPDWDKGTNMIYWVNTSPACLMWFLWEESMIKVNERVLE
jgi:hypothetical protein